MAMELKRARLIGRAVVAFFIVVWVALFSLAAIAGYCDFPFAFPLLALAGLIIVQIQIRAISWSVDKELDIQFPNVKGWPRA